MRQQDGKKRTIEIILEKLCRAKYILETSYAKVVLALPEIIKLNQKTPK